MLLAIKNRLILAIGTNNDSEATESANDLPLRLN